MDGEDIIGFSVLVILGMGIILAFGSIATYRDKSDCARDAKMMKQDYKYSHGTCYIKQGSKYYPEDMLKHVTVGDEDFE